MSSIGIIVRADRDATDLAKDWVPPPLGSRAEVLAAVRQLVPTDDPALTLALEVEDANENEDPRTISVSGVWGHKERAVLRKLCDRLGARFYDAEEAEFAEL